MSDIQNNKNFRILLVDDEQDILDIISYNLEKEGYQIRTADNGRTAIEIAAAFKPDLILLDVMMPEMDGIETCVEMRQNPSLESTVIAFLTARGEDYSQIAGFEAGADDYISKPIRPRLLASKVESLFRRANSIVEQESSESSLNIDRDKFIITIAGKNLNLPKKEFELLELLATRPGKVYTRDQILKVVWGDEAIVGERTIDVHIRKLREKIGNDYIRTIKGVGYTFEEF